MTDAPAPSAAARQSGWYIQIGAVGSKAAAIEMTNASLALKVVIEQMREQIQNLE